jgi:hypothetical protein
MKKKTKVNFKETISNVNFATQTAPVIKEVMGKDYIEYGTEDYRNLYPQFLIDLFYSSSTHAAIVNATSDMIAGESITVEETDNLDAYVKLKRFLAQANSKGESLHSIIKKIAFDFKLHGAYALNVVWSKDRTELEIYHVPVERIRMGKPDALGRVSEYFISSDWSNTRRNKPQAVPAFNVNDRTSPNAIIYDGMYSPNMQLYKVPDYVAACNWCLVDQKIAEYHLANIENGFSASMFINFSNGVPSAEERQQVENSIARKFEGSGNAGKTVITFSDDKNRTPEIVPISMSEADKTYIALQELMVANILTGHRVTSPMLFGINKSEGLGSNVDELNSAFEVYLNTVVKPFQNNILSCLGRILEVNGINLPIEFVQNKPITTRFSLEDMKSVMTEDEIRAELGLPSLTDNEEVAEDEFQKMSEEQDELDKFIAEFGEDAPEDYELIDDEIVEEEDEDFDFEKELNEISRLDLATTGTARPNSRSKQDGIDKEYNLYKVRYEYAEDTGLTRESGKSRSFCTKMLAANKMYRKEDLIRLENIPVNKGWGAGGTDTYSIWLYGGGGNCHHYFRRKIWKFTLGVSRSGNLEDGDVISTAKARKSGFYPKANDKKVAQAPKRMPNKGFIK